MPQIFCLQLFTERTKSVLVTDVCIITQLVRQHETKEEEKFASILIIIFKNCSHPPDIHAFVEHNLLYYCVGCKLVIVAGYKKSSLPFLPKIAKNHTNILYFTFLT